MGRSRLLILLAVILTLAVLGVAGFLYFSGGASIGATNPANGSSSPQGPEVQPTIPLKQVIVALQPIARGASFVSGSIGRRDWPNPDSLPPDIIADEVETIGKVARTDIVQGQLIIRSMLTDPGESSEASLQIPAGKVAIAYPINRQSSVAYAIQSGDTVDILVTAFFYDVDEEFQTKLPNKVKFIVPKQEYNEDIGIIVSGIELLDEPIDQGHTDIYGEGEQAITTIIYGSEAQIPRRVAQLTVQAAKVVKVGSWFVEPTAGPPQNQEASGGGSGGGGGNNNNNQQGPTPTPKRPDIVTLAVTPQDALVLLWLRQSGISSEMALRAANEENADHLTEAVTLQYMLTRFNIAVPPKIDIVMQEPPSVERIRRELELLGMEPLDLLPPEQQRQQQRR